MNPQVHIGQGTLEGLAEDGTLKFLGIPYAAPPVGYLRWREPKPLAPWEGVRHAKQFGPVCPQTIGASFDVRQSEQSEDCLYLNVWTQSCNLRAKQPVMLWIHGGGNLGGAGSEDACDGTKFAGKGVTLVTFNYRLGAFGFLAHPKIGGNFGVLDHLAALSWVQANIAAFGGDPGNVTIFGESAGAVAVRTLFSCPRAHGLFHRAILQSVGFEQPAVVPSWSEARAHKAAEALFTKLGSQEPEKLRLSPTSDLLRASHELSGLPPPPGQVHTPANLTWMPIADGSTVFPDGLPGWRDNVPIMMGCVENEARYFIKPGGSYTDETLAQMARVLCGRQGPEVHAMLERSGLPLYERLDKIFTTAIWTEPALHTIRKFSALGRRCYYYHFNKCAPGAVALNEMAKHTAEIRYVFGTLTDDHFYDESDRRTSELLQNAWISFARDGSPTSPDGLPWPCYDAARPKMAWIENDVEIQSFPTTELMLAINKLR